MGTSANANMVKGKKLVPPDGGWGWVVVFGVSVINLCTRSLEQCFGLLFADLFTELKIETTGAAAIASGLDVLVNFSGLLVGPLIRIYSYRTVSVMGTALCSLGLLLTVPAKSMGHIFVTYSIITGFGVGLAVSSTFVAVSNYFVDRRGVAVGLSLAGTAVGMVIMPHAVRLLLETYFFRGTTLILGAFAMHGIVGSMLLQPVENHLVPAKVQLEEGEYVQEMETIKEHEEENPDVPEGKTLLTKNFSEVTIKNAEDNPKQNMTRKATFPRNFSTVSVGGAQRRRKTSMESMISSYSRLDFTGSSIQMNIDATEREFDESVRHQPFGSALRMRGALSKDEPKRTLLQKFVDFMDLDLLKCPIYLNLVFCLSISFVAEQNFKAVLPFFFDDLGYTKQDIANFLSIQSFADIIARSCLPPICDRINWTKKSLCFWCILSMGLSRSLLASQTNYTAIIICLLICGFIRGAAIVNFTITIAEYTTQKFSNLDKLASAYGLHMVGKGLASVMLGPLLGYIRDTTHSYPICIHSETCLLVTSCIAWAVEYTIIWCRQKNKSTIAATTT